MMYILYTLYTTMLTVDGHFKAWSDWSACSQTCDSGVKTRTRGCVPPLHGGAPCGPHNLEKAPCLQKQCPGNVQFKRSLL